LDHFKRVLNYSSVCWGSCSGSDAEVQPAAPTPAAGISSAPRLRGGLWRRERRGDSRLHRPHGREQPSPQKAKMMEKNKHSVKMRNWCPHLGRDRQRVDSRSRENTGIEQGFHLAGCWWLPQRKVRALHSRAEEATTRYLSKGLL